MCVCGRGGGKFLNSLTTDLSQWLPTPDTPWGPLALFSLLTPWFEEFGLSLTAYIQQYEALGLVKADFWKEIWQPLWSGASIAISGSEKNLKPRAQDLELLHFFSYRGPHLLSLFCGSGAVVVILFNCHKHPFSDPHFRLRELRRGDWSGGGMWPA